MDEMDLHEDLLGDLLEEEEPSLYDEVMMSEEESSAESQNPGCDVCYTILQKNQGNLHRLNAFLYRCQEFFEQKSGEKVRSAFLFGDNAGGESTVSAALRPFAFARPGERLILDESLRSSGILENLLFGFLTLREHCALSDHYTPVYWMILMNREIPPAMLESGAWRQMVREIRNWKEDMKGRYGSAARIYVWQETSAGREAHGRERAFELGDLAEVCDGVYWGEKGELG